MNIKINAVYGGTDIKSQIKSLSKGNHIIVGTPGRVIDLIKRKKINLERINTVVMDEADEMLNMGFKKDIDTILQKTPNRPPYHNSFHNRYILLYYYRTIIIIEKRIFRTVYITT